MIGNKLAVKFDQDHPVISKTIQLMVASRATCDSAETDWNIAQTGTDDSIFRLPPDFAGTFRLRAMVRSSAAESGPRLGEVWIAKIDSEGKRQELSRCPSVLADGPFASSGLSDPAAGWAGPEPWGVWTVGRHASLRPIPISSAAANSDLVLNANVRAFVPGRGKQLRVDVRANGTNVANWAFSEVDSNAQRPSGYHNPSCLGARPFRFRLIFPIRFHPPALGCQRTAVPLASGSSGLRSRKSCNNSAGPRIEGIEADCGPFLEDRQAEAREFGQDTPRQSIGSG